MFRILGTDGRENGPVPAEVVCQWVKEGRADGNTKVHPEGATDWCLLRTVPELAISLPSPPPVPPTPPQPASSGGGINTVIPYRNAPALVGYYCAVFSLIPILGAVPGLIGFALGIIGLRNARRNPLIGGKVHSWIGIILGGLCGFGYLTLVIVVLFATTRARGGRH